MWGKKTADGTGQVLCSFLKNPTVFIEPMPRHKMMLLMEEYQHQEWLGYLRGKISKEGNIFVEDLEIPPHSVAAGASAEAEPFHIPVDCVGVIHSHHGMGAFHSGTDQNFVDKNFPVSITVARNGANEMVFDAISFQLTPCGRASTTKVTVKYVLPPASFDKGKFLKEAKANIDKANQVTSYQPLLNQLDDYNLPYAGFQDRVLYTRESRKGLEYFVDDKGNVLTQKDIDDIMHDIWKDNDPKPRNGWGYGDK